MYYGHKYLANLPNLEIIGCNVVFMVTKRVFLFVVGAVCSTLLLNAQRVDYSVVNVPEESGVDFTRITTDNDNVCMPFVKRASKRINWLSNRILGVSNDGQDLAYLSARNNTTNIFIKDLSRQSSSVQRTNRQAVLDFSYSPDGKYICFSEKQGRLTQIYQTDAKSGYVCRQITSGNEDYSPIYSPDMGQIFFARSEKKGISIWSYSIVNNYLSNYTLGMDPYPVNDNTTLCTRTNLEGRCEIWRINYGTGVEERLLSDARHSFTTPSVSPDGNWILMTGSSEIATEKSSYWNTDIYVCRIDGTQLQQLTYHAADDLSPVWSKDGKYIYFISQRGSAEARANVWRMPFVIK